MVGIAHDSKSCNLGGVKVGLDNAIFYSLIETCDIVGVNPLQWLTFVLENLHDDTTSEDIELMLPYQ